ncbi:hypothetical protein Tco_0080364 [Tanacetum coccineum]
MTETILNENMEKDQTESNLSITSNDINVELNKEFLEEIQMNAYHRCIDEDIVNHIAKGLRTNTGILQTDIVLPQSEVKLPKPWILFTDGSSCVDGSGAGLILTNPEGMEFTYALRFEFTATNNEAEYEALIARLRIAAQMGVRNLEANVESRLVANHVLGEYVAKEDNMIQYLDKTRNNANPSYQERRQSMEDTLSKFMGESAKRHEENSNLIKEIRASTDAAIRNEGASIKTLEIQIGQMSKVLQEKRDLEAYLALLKRTREIKSSRFQLPLKLIHTRYAVLDPPNTPPYQKGERPGSFTLHCFINNVCFDNALVDLGASISVMPLSTYLNLGLGELAHTKLTVELADRTVKYPKGIAKNVLVGIGKFVFPVDFIILDMPEDIKVPLILRRPFLSTARAKIDVYKRKITLRVGEERIVFTSVKPASSLIKRVYMLSLRRKNGT